MSASLSVGAYVQHVRFGPARVVEVTSDSVVLARRGDEDLTVSVSDAERVLLPMPNDGFCALLWSRNLDSKFLGEHIEDIVLRLMRDRRRRSITLDEIKRALSPVLAKDGKGWESWWTIARRQLLAGHSISVDPKKKNVFAATDAAPNVVTEDWDAQVRDAKTPQRLLAVAKSLELAPDQVRSEKAWSIAKAGLAAFPSAPNQDRAFFELVCCFSYVLPFVTKTDAETIMATIDGRGLRDVSVPADLDEELSTALTRLSRCTSFPDLALALLKHPSPQVQTRAFGALNTERHRVVLKKALLDWIRNPDDRDLPKPSLYLREDLLQYLRSEDRFHLFRNLLERPAIVDSPAVREFLESSVGAVFSSREVDESLRISILRSQLLSDKVKRDAIRHHPRPEDLVVSLIAQFDPEMKRPLAWTISDYEGALPMEMWPRILDIIKITGDPDLFEATAKHSSHWLGVASGPEALAAASWVCALLNLCDEFQPDCQHVLESALEQFGRKLSKVGSSNVPEPLIRGTRGVVETTQREVRRDVEMLAKENESLRLESMAAKQEAQRLTDLLETLKSSAAFDRHEVEANSRTDAVRPFLLLLDDLERQLNTGGTPAGSIVGQVENAIKSAGLSRIGASGETVAFDASLHEFLEEPGSVPSVASVRVVRAGYLLVGQTPRVVRRALVRPAW
jgi:molecular chaperone GrpE (heat shock protein)